MIVWFGQSVVAAHKRSVGSRRCTCKLNPSIIWATYWDQLLWIGCIPHNIYVYCNVFPCYMGVFWHLVCCVWQSSACVAWYGTDEGIILIRCLGNVTHFSSYLTAFLSLYFRSVLLECLRIVSLSEFGNLY